MPPSAIRQNFSDEPRPSLRCRRCRVPATPRCAHRDANGWRRRATARWPAARMRSSVSTSPSRRNAPLPARHATSRRRPAPGPRPNTATPSSIRAMLTVNSPLRLTNSRVPSSGSTSQNRDQCAARCPRHLSAASSTGPGCPGVSRPQASDDAAMRGQVGGGQRRAVVLVLDLERAFVDAQDRRGGLAGDARSPPRAVRVPGHAWHAHACSQPLPGDEQCGDASGLRKNPRAGSTRAAHPASTAPLPAPRARRRAGVADTGRAPAPAAADGSCRWAPGVSARSTHRSARAVAGFFLAVRGRRPAPGSRRHRCGP